MKQFNHSIVKSKLESMYIIPSSVPSFTEKIPVDMCINELCAPSAPSSSKCDCDCFCVCPNVNICDLSTRTPEKRYCCCSISEDDYIKLFLEEIKEDKPSKESKPIAKSPYNGPDKKSR